MALVIQKSSANIYRKYRNKTKVTHTFLDFIFRVIFIHSVFVIEKILIVRKLDI